METEIMPAEIPREAPIRPDTTSLIEDTPGTDA